jgi:hypothetical protein
VEAEPHFRDWCMDIVRASTELRDEQRQIVQFAVVPDLDMVSSQAQPPLGRISKSLGQIQNPDPDYLMSGLKSNTTRDDTLPAQPLLL